MVESEIEGLSFREVVEDTRPGEAVLDLEITAQTNLVMAGAYFCVDLPDAEFGGGTLELISADSASAASLTLSRTPSGSGPELIRQGLATRQLLGDTAHGTPAALDFIRPALADPAIHRYIGAIAFHTWRGCTVESLPGWAEAARQLGVPLLVTESSPDAHLHEYPSVRLEPWFQLQEIDLYLRICAFGQPATIMEWQFTTDYSVLTGQDIYGESGPLRPTQRFWNLKQLGATPAGAFALPMRADQAGVTCAAFGDLANDRYAVHIVNNGARRHAVLTGLPQSITALRCFNTDAIRRMEESESVQVQGGKAELTLPTASYVTLMNSNGR